ncbi:hypothetical protein AAHC03_01408 [Spirometra sp. Aus1]
MAELSFMSVDPDIEMSTVEMDIDEKVSESPYVEQTAPEDVPNVERNRSNLYIVLEYCPGGELFRYLEREGFLMEDAACFYISEIALAIGHLHSLGIIYRDLKPENILLDKAGHVKLTDFGLSKEGACTTNTFCGTIEYMAPEIIRCAGHGRAVDWWSLGTLLFDMLSGGPPFSQEENKKATAEKILKSQVKFPPSFSPEAISLIRGLLKKDPKERLGAKNDVEEIKQQRFFKRYDINWTDVYDRKMEPPFRPELLSDSDVSMFDPTFTGLQPIVSPGNADESVPGDLFQGFSFVASSIIEPSPRGVLPDLNRNRGPPRGVRGAISMGRLSRMNGITPTLMTNPTVGGAHSFGQQNKNRTRPDCAPTAGIATNPAVVPVMLPSIPNRYGGYEVDDPLPSHGCDLSDFASNPSAPVVNCLATTVPQASQLPPADRGNPEKNQLIVTTSRTTGGGTEENCTVYSAEAPSLSSRMLNTFREADEKEEDEDNIPGAQRIGQQTSRRGLMAGESSTASSKIKPLIEAPRDHRSHAPVNGSKTLADTKPFSYPNLLVSPSGLKSQPTRASSKPVMRSVSPVESVESATKRAPHATSPAGQYKSAAHHHHLQPQQPQQLHRVGSGSAAPSNPPHAVSGGSNNAKCSVM